MSTDQNTDDRLDERLHEAGRRWRAANTTAATVDLAAIVESGAFEPGSAESAPAERGGSELSGSEPSGAGPGGSEPSGSEPSGSEPSGAGPSGAGRPRSRRRTWLAAGAGIAAAAVAVAVAVGLGAGRSEHPRPSGDSPVLTAITWQLSGYSYLSPQGRRTVGANGNEGPPFVVPNPATVRFDAGGKVSGSDGCNTFGGTARISGQHITFGQLASTEIGCLDPQVSATSEAIHAILQGTVTWSVAGNQLTMRKSGVGDFEFRARPDPATSSNPSALVGVSWTLTTIEHGTTGDGTASSTSASVLLVFGAKVAFTVDHRCYVRSGSVAISDGRADFTHPRTDPHSCPYHADPGGAQAADDSLVDAVLDGSTTWSITSDRLTIGKAGVGTLVFVTTGIDPGFTGQSSTSSPSATATR